MNSSNRRNRWIAATLLVATSAVMFTNFAAGDQAPPPQPAGINPESMYGKESAQGVYVRDSAVALEKFAQAQRMERLKEWSKAADLYQEVLEKFGDRVVPSQVDKDNNIYQYTSVIAAVQEKMSHWPADGLEVYRTRYEAAAAALLESARADDRAATQSVLSKYFATDTAKTAGLRLIDLYFEAGEFSAAAWLGDLLLTRHPNLIVERPRVMYRTALALHMAGETEKSKAILVELQNKYPQETATLRGTDQKLAEVLAADLAQPAPRATVMADSSWPMFGGSPSRSRLSTAAGRPGAKIQTIELTKPNYKGLQGELIAQWKQRDVADQDSGATINVMPAVDRGELYFQDGIRLSAVSIDTAQPLAGWMQRYPERKGQYQVGNSRIPPRGVLYTVTLTDKFVLAVMGQTDRLAQLYRAGGAPGEGKLVCLNRATGKEEWAVQSRSLPDEAAAVRGSEFTGSPLVVDGNVYIAVRSAKGGQFEDCLVLCFDLETGKYKWNCYVASANSVANAMMMDGEGPAAPADNVAQLAYAGGRLYVLTNLGALASIDAYGGRIVWLSIYPRDETSLKAMANPWQARMNGRVVGSVSSKPWMTNPVFVDNGKVFVLPGDGKFLQIYDAGSGVEVKRIDPKHLTPPPLPGESSAAADSLIAVNGPRLLVTGPKSAMYLNWEKYTAEGFDKRRNPAIEWPRNFSASVRGRAFIANERAFFPTQDRMLVISLKGGKVQEEYPDYVKYPKGWLPDDAEGPGNIVVSDDHVIIAANRRIDIYTNMDAARQRLDAALSKNPTSPDTRLEYAEVMFVAGDIDTGMKKLDEAIDLIGGREKMAAGPVRDRIYNIATNFAQKFSRDLKDADSGNLPVVQQLYDRTAAAASSASQQVNYRMLRAKLATTIKDFPLAVKLYQQVITSADWRKVLVMDETSGAQTPASLFARRSIDALIRQAGPICYAGFEQEAIQEFDAAKAAGQADAIANVAVVYPNAKVAPQALMAAADLKDAAGDHRGAVQLLRQLYLSYPTPPDKQRVLESMARNYMSIPNRSSVAIARLAEAVKLGDAPLAKPMPLPGGKSIEQGTLSQALAELKKARGQEIAKSLPDFKLPIPHFAMVPVVNKAGVAEMKKKPVEPFVPETPALVMSNVHALVVPALEYQRYDRIATYTPGVGLSIFAVGSTEPIAKIPATDFPAMAWGTAGPIAWTGGQATQLRGDTNETAWTFDARALPAVEVIAATGADDGTSDSKSGDAETEIMLQENQNARIIINGRRRLLLQNGRVQELPVAPNPAGKPVINNPGGGEAIVDLKPIGETVLVITSSGRMVALNAADGNVRWQTRLSDHAAERMVVNEDFIATLQRDENLLTLTVLDTFSGQTIGRRTFEDNFKVPNNFALSPDGTLVYLLPDRIVLKNLYEQWASSDQEIVDARAATSGQFPYVTSTQPDQLQIVDGRILVMADQNATLRVFSMETGKPLRYTPVDSKKEIDLVFQTGNRQAAVPVSVRVVGSQVYLIGQQSMMAYNLDRPNLSWRMPPLISRDEAVDAFVGRNHLVLLADTKAKINAGKVAGYRLYAYARYGSDENDSEESGVTTYIQLRTDPAGILTWQAVDGGFYYLAADQKLHFLKGAGN